MQNCQNVSTDLSQMCRSGVNQKAAVKPNPGASKYQKIG